MGDLTHQTSAVTALLRIITTEKLPDCTWIVYRELGLEGSIIDDPDSDPMDDMQRWAQRLGTGVQRDGDSRMLYTVGTYAHAQVRVFAKERKASPDETDSGQETEVRHG